MTPLDCHVFWARPSDGWATAGGWLDAAERGRRDKLLREADRARFVTAAGLLRRVVGERIGADPGAVAVDRSCPDCDRPHGRPVIPGAGLEVSVSHSGDLVAVALVPGPSPVGVDVELIDPDPDVEGMTRLVLSEAEQRQWPLDRAAFYRVWTRKEAVLKATGDGLRTPMTDLSMSAADEPPVLLSYAGRPDLRARVADLSPGPGYGAAVAVLTEAAVAWHEEVVTAP